MGNIIMFRYLIISDTVICSTVLIIVPVRVATGSHRSAAAHSFDAKTISRFSINSWKNGRWACIIDADKENPK